MGGLEARSTFWDYLNADAVLYRDVVGAFLGLMRCRFEQLSDLVTDPAIEDFSLPDGDDYRSYIAAEFGKRGKPWP